MTEELHTYYCKDCFKKQEQIERLEQENKELRKANEISIEKVTVTAEAKRLQELEQENKELKKVKEQLKKWNDENLKRQDDMQKWIDLAEEQRKNYRSALEEIREILQKPDLPTDDEDNLMTATELLLIVDANRRTKLMNIQDRINEVL